MKEFTVQEIYKAAILGPLYNGSETKQKDVMDKTEDNYLNPYHKDCQFVIRSDPKRTSGRKKEEWGIYQAYKEKFVERIGKEMGVYKITEKGKAFIEDFSERLEHKCIELDEKANRNTKAFTGIKEGNLNLFSPKGITMLRNIYKTNQTAIKARQAEEVREKIKSQPL